MVDRLEEKRKVKAAAFYERKSAALKLRTSVLKSAVAAQPLSEKLAEFGY